MRSNEVADDLSGPMQKVQEKLGRSLKGYLEEQYASGTIDDVAAAIRRDASTSVDRSTVSKWMDRLGIERRFPGQRPAVVA